MTKRSMTLAPASLATLLALFAPTPVARADIFQWEYINPPTPAWASSPARRSAPTALARLPGALQIL